MRKLFKWLAVGLITPSIVVASYLGAALVTARIPAKVEQVEPGNGQVKIYLLTSLLHADIALPFSPKLRKRFAFLENTGVPLNHPELRYITVGWGSRAFYRTAGSYWDIKPSAVFQAVIGDRSVLRWVGFGTLVPSDDTIQLSLNSNQYERLLEEIEKAHSKSGERFAHMDGDSIGPNDAFFEAIGHFNIFRPCNQWVNEVLRSSGVPLGVWTPTTQSLIQSLKHFRSSTEAGLN